MKAGTGHWTPSTGLTFTYQWLANGIKIAGATHSSYKITPGIVGRKLTVTVTASKAAYTKATATSEAQKVQPGTIRNNTLPSISGTVRVGSTVTAVPGRWTPSTGLTFTYQWYAKNGKIAGATHSTYKIPPRLADGYLTVNVTASRAGYVAEYPPNSPTVTATSLGHSVAYGVLVGKIRPTLTGIPKVGSTLTVATGTWSPAPTSIHVRWYAFDAPMLGGGPLGTGPTFKITPAMKGATITAIVIADKTGYNSEVVELKEPTKIR